MPTHIQVILVSLGASYAVLWALSNPSPLIMVLMALGASYAFLWASAYTNQDPNEPPPVAGSIPMISPLIGLMTEKENYYVRMRQVVLLITC